MRELYLRKICLITVIILCAALIASCGNKSEIISSELAQKLTDEISFAEQLEEIDSASAARLLYLNPNDYSDITMYIGTKSTCDEFAIIKTSSPDSVKKKLTAYLEKEKSDYLVYRPAEADKLDNAYITDYKDTVVMVICGSPESAETSFKNYLKK